MAFAMSPGAGPAAKAAAKGTETNQLQDPTLGVGQVASLPASSAASQAPEPHGRAGAASGG